MGMMCVDMCVAEYQCPQGLTWDPVGQCVNAAECSVFWEGPPPPSIRPGGDPNLDGR